MALTGTTLAMMSACVHVAPPLYPGPVVAARQTDDWYHHVTRQAQHGDWILMRGYTPFHTLVRAAGRTTWSHVGIYDGERGCVIDAAPLGVRAKPLRTYLRRMHQVQILRPYSQSPHRARAAVDFARARIGCGYDYGAIVGFPHPARWTCVEFVLDAYGLRLPGHSRTRPAFPDALHDLGREIYDSRPRTFPIFDSL